MKNPKKDVEKSAHLILQIFITVSFILIFVMMLLREVNVPPWVYFILGTITTYRFRA